MSIQIFDHVYHFIQSKPGVDILPIGKMTVTPYINYGEHAI